MNRLKNSSKKIKVYLTILCVFVLNTSTHKTQAWIIEDSRIFVRNVLLIILAAIALIIIGIIAIRKELGSTASAFIKKSF